MQQTHTEENNKEHVFGPQNITTATKLFCPWPWPCTKLNISNPIHRQPNHTSYFSELHVPFHKFFHSLYTLQMQYPLFSTALSKIYAHQWWNSSFYNVHYHQATIAFSSYFVAQQQLRSTTVITSVYNTVPTTFLSMITEHAWYSAIPFCINYTKKKILTCFMKSSIWRISSSWKRK